MSNRGRWMVDEEGKQYIASEREFQDAVNQQLVKENRAMGVTKDINDLTPGEIDDLAKAHTCDVSDTTGLDVCHGGHIPDLDQLSELGPGETVGHRQVGREAYYKAPTRATTFPLDAAGRKAHPVASGVFDYFPDALVAVAGVSFVGNEQHSPGQPLHWARGKSTDEADALIRHFLERGGKDNDGLRHSAKMAWRALALLQKEIEGEVQ